MAVSPRPAARAARRSYAIAISDSEEDESPSATSTLIRKRAKVLDDEIENGATTTTEGQSSTTATTPEYVDDAPEQRGTRFGKASRSDTNESATPSDGHEQPFGYRYGSDPFVLVPSSSTTFNGRAVSRTTTTPTAPRVMAAVVPPSTGRSSLRNASSSSIIKPKQTTLASFFGRSTSAAAATSPTAGPSSRATRPTAAAAKPRVASSSSARPAPRKSKQDSDDDFVVDDDESDQSDASMEDEASVAAASPEPAEDESGSIGPLSDDSDDEPAKTKRKKATGTASGSKLGVSGQKWMSAFRQAQKGKQIDHCPNEAQASKLAKEAEQKGKDKIWPPISDLGDIYTDIVDRMPEKLLKPLAETLAGQGRALRVATMCSGTESPLLALNLISRAVEAKWGIKMGIDHVFSCELEPFKQAYIERNFKPPLLFRDVTELGNAKAHTAYGALVDVPGDIDLLVAGTSCVDYSGLNNKKKGMSEGGESGRTFFGMLEWVKRHQPAIVILENVKSAPWEGVGKHFEDVNYDSTFSTRFDTKNYYIPQTRQRGYFFATRNNKAGYPPNWHNLVSSLQRPASSPIEAFMLPTNDQRIQTARNNLGHEQAGKSRSTIDWSKCQGRHEHARGFEKLGQARPFTAWEEGGSCIMSHGAWNEFARPQPERVLDLMDITVLRDARKGEDSHYKSRVWELSQNVDRNIVATQPGITGCLTPSGMPFLTSRGGPVTGLEALSLQGLPIDELLLTRESGDQLQNLAGNAMSSTVVGICILSALVLARPDLEKDRQSGNHRGLPVEKERRQCPPIMIRGEQELASQARPYDLVSLVKVDMPTLLARAAASSQLCICEGAADVKTDIYRCTACDHTVCESCKARPSHQLELDLKAQQGHRESPRAFEDYLKAALPMRMQFGADLKRLETALKDAAASISGLDGRDIQRWLDRVTTVLAAAEFRFSHLKRDRVWTAQYHHSSARLELVLDQTDCHWRVFVEAAKSEPAGSMLRKLLKQPVARLRLDPSQKETTLLEASASWEVNLPSRHHFKAILTSHGEQVDTWEASLGLRGDFEGTKRYSRIRVELEPDLGVRDSLVGEDQLTGEYELLPHCGQANGSLHKRLDDSTSPLYLFIDAARYGSAKDDAYVFSRELGLPPYPLERKKIATLKPGWKPDQAPRDLTAGDEELTPEEFERLSAKYQESVEKRSQKEQTVDAKLCGRWCKMSDFHLKPLKDAKESTIAVPSAPVTLDLSKAGCEEALTVLLCQTALTSHADDAVWPARKGHWTSVNLEHQSTTTFGMLAWLIERVPEVAAWQDWMKASYDAKACSCPICAPPPPSIQWLKEGNTQPVPIENEIEAGPYEQALKSRPFPFMLHLRTEEDGLAHVRLAMNPATLMHRALSRLPSRADSEKPLLDWRLSRIDPTLTPYNLPEYRLSSNRHDVEADNPSMFKLELRKEQKRSLTWMLNQEAEDVEPFVEEEVSEASLPALEWCAEGRARQTHTVRGGVIADAVGYGKTAISLALIAAQKAKERERPGKADKNAEDEGFIKTGATLIIVPPQLCKQWQSEVSKFAGKSLSVHVIYSKTDLNKTTIKTLQNVDIVIMSVSVYKADSYFESLAAFAAANPIPAKEGRFFDSAMAKSVAALRNRVKELKLNDGGKTVWKSIKDRKDFDPAHLTTYKAKKRIVGAQYARKKAIQDDGRAENAATVEDAWAAIKKEKVSDVWGLAGGKLGRWTDLTSPPLEAFAWRRVIIDEFHYIAADAGRVFSAVRSLTGQATWILSGTPKTNDFAEIRSMAAFLDVHLGVEDDADYGDASTRGRSSRNKGRSEVERFRNFVEFHSPAWHHRRQALGQAFLDRFVRQNIAEIDEIASIEILKPIRMPAAERACYLELQHTIEALDLRHARSFFRGPAQAKGIISENDRDHRLRLTLGQSSSPEEALSRQAAHFVLSTKEKARNAIEACDLIVRERADQLEKCQAELAAKLKATREQHFLCLMHYGYRDDTKQALVTFAKNAIGAKYGDKESKQLIATLLEQEDCLEDDLTRSQGRQSYPAGELNAALKRRAVAAALADYAKERGAASKAKKKAAASRKRSMSADSDEEAEFSADDKLDAKSAAAEKKVSTEAVKQLEAQLSNKKKMNEDERLQMAWAQETHLRALVHQLVQLRNETAARQRSLRYFENIRSIQLSQGQGLPADVAPDCSGCRAPLSFDILALSSVCGHLFCEACGRREAWKGKCPESGCNADAKPTSIVKATSLGVENEDVSAFGEKMSQLAHLLRDESMIPKKDKVILFVQFEGLLKKTAHALQSYGIKFTRVDGSAKQRSETLDAYQNGRAPRVLLLDVADESAAGSNLTIANHVIFLSSLVTEDAATYRSTLQQARGRCLRFGQTKEVHVWQLLARGTIDEDIFDAREALARGSSATGGLDAVLEQRTPRQKELGRQMEKEMSREEEAAREKKSEGDHERDVKVDTKGKKKAPAKEEKSPAKPRQRKAAIVDDSEDEEMIGLVSD